MGNSRLQRMMREIDGETGAHASQFFLNHPLKHLGEYRLMIAVLEQAFIDIHPRGAESATWRTIRHDTFEWFNAEDRDGLYSFGSICDTAGFTTDRIRARALEMLRRHERVTIYRQEKQPAHPTTRTKREETRERAERSRSKSRGQST